MVLLSGGATGTEAQDLLLDGRTLPGKGMKPQQDCKSLLTGGHRGVRNNQQGLGVACVVAAPIIMVPEVRLLELNLQPWLSFSEKTKVASCPYWFLLYFTIASQQTRSH
jgi:hypothetical protein